MRVETCGAQAEEPERLHPIVGILEDERRVVIIDGHIEA
jgi:hypothetical protein